MGRRKRELVQRKGKKRKKRMEKGKRERKSLYDGRKKERKKDGKGECTQVGHFCR